jgi:hypothetical protein
MQEKANINQLAADWARITIDRWRKQIQKKRIGQSGKLFNSFVSNIIRNSDGNPSKIELSFLYYGRFVDMGVGRGISIGGQMDERTMRGRAEALRNARRPKKWYSPTKGAETQALAQLLAREFGIKGINIMEEGFSNLNSPTTKFEL